MKSLHKFFDPRLIAILTAILSLFWTSRISAQQEDTGELQTGAQLYTENCEVCHGLNGEGRVGATLAKDWPSIRPDLATMATIAQGIPGTAMPAWSQENGGPLTNEEIDAVVAYILSWQTGGAPVIIPQATVTSRPAISPIPEVSGDPNRGAILYDYNCALCHGVDGGGRIGATLAKNWGSIRPDLAIKSTISSGVSGSPMPAWSQENGGPLTEVEIDDIVAFVMSWSAPAEPAAPTPAPPETSRLAGWGGVLFAVLLFALLVGLILLFQRRKY